MAPILKQQNCDDTILSGKKLGSLKLLQGEATFTFTFLYVSVCTVHGRRLASMHVCVRAREFLVYLFICGATEVDELDLLRGRVIEQILPLDVAVHDALVVNVVHSFPKLQKHKNT